MPKKKKDSPEILKLREKLDKARAEFERWYTRLVRSMTRLHKAKKQVRRLTANLEHKINLEDWHKKTEDIPL